ncbi:hypothetical protein [Lelliottia amnigena]|jgi:hypothetical protein|uniref:hypothetical protein n=1 Tax=Lelliottia amnigena TaxID=61646 RepID=UPI00192B5F13|nr:hypothetical protein [Lelliottia amnigena]MBL5966893.1 hypothetical protein [Lelliottia amnigena]QXB20571.1 hypothetical protein I6L76_15275 [Lelliottia amnigena]
MLIWNEFIKLLGCSKLDGKFIEISSDFNELPAIEESVLGDRNYYSFLHSGVLFLLEDEVVDQITFYAKQGEGFSEYKGELPVSINSSEHEAVQILGHPSASGGGKMDALMGYIDRWIKYEKDGYALHLQFNQNDNLSRVTLIK